MSTNNHPIVDFLEQADWTRVPFIKTAPNSASHAEVLHAVHLFGSRKPFDRSWATVLLRQDDLELEWIRQDYELKHGSILSDDARVGDGVPDMAVDRENDIRLLNFKQVFCKFRRGQLTQEAQLGIIFIVETPVHPTLFSELFMLHMAYFGGQLVLERCKMDAVWPCKLVAVGASVPQPGFYPLEFSTVFAPGASGSCPAPSDDGPDVVYGPDNMDTLPAIVGNFLQKQRENRNVLFYGSQEEARGLKRASKEMFSPEDWVKNEFDIEMLADVNAFQNIQQRNNPIMFVTRPDRFTLQPATHLPNLGLIVLRRSADQTSMDMRTLLPYTVNMELHPKLLEIQREGVEKMEGTRVLCVARQQNAIPHSESRHTAENDLLHLIFETHLTFPAIFRLELPFLVCKEKARVVEEAERRLHLMGLIMDEPGGGTVATEFGHRVAQALVSHNYEWPFRVACIVANAPLPFPGVGSGFLTPAAQRIMIGLAFVFFSPELETLLAPASWIESQLDELVPLYPGPARHAAPLGCAYLLYNAWQYLKAWTGSDFTEQNFGDRREYMGLKLRIEACKMILHGVKQAESWLRLPNEDESTTANDMLIMSAKLARCVFDHVFYITPQGAWQFANQQVCLEWDAGPIPTQSLVTSYQRLHPGRTNEFFGFASNLRRNARGGLTATNVTMLIDGALNKEFIEEIQTGWRY